MNHIDQSLEAFLSDLKNRGIKLWADGDNLRCTAPKNSMTADIQKKIASQKQLILCFLKQTDTKDDITLINTHKESNTIPRLKLKPEQPLPLSFSQQRLWFLDQLEKSATYNIPAALHIQGFINADFLEKSLNDIVQRHEVLRTTFRGFDHHFGQTTAFPGSPSPNDDQGFFRNDESEINASPFSSPTEGTAVQIIKPFLKVPLNLLDLSLLTQEKQQAETKLWIEQGEKYLFNLSDGPLLWVMLIKLVEDQHLLLLTMHHIIADGWSVGVLIQEMTTFYSGYCSQKPTVLPPLPIQYADFSLWQRTWLNQGELDRQLNYWQTQLTDLPEIIKLATDRPRPPVQSFRGSVERFKLDLKLTKALKIVSRNHNTTLFMTLLTGFTVLLNRYSNQEDIVIGSPVANRNRSELEPLIGFFLNTLVLRINCEKYPTFEQLLKQVKKTTLDAYNHQDVPFEHLVERLKPTRSRSYSPLFQVMFGLQNTPKKSLKLPGLELTQLDQQFIPAKYDLYLGMEESEDSILGEFEYNTDLFDQSTLHRMIDHFKNLLHSATQNPELMIQKMPMLNTMEYHQMVTLWNQTTLQEPPSFCLHTLLEKQILENPNKTALMFGNESLSYLQLNEQANQLAHYLIAQGVKSGSLVGICLERSFNTVIGVLAILKAGGAYIPMDPYHPKDRLKLLIEDSNLQWMVTHSTLLQQLPDHQALTIVIDKMLDSIQQCPTTNPQTEVNPKHPAYVIYTSGSTGRPKGVVVLHGRLTRMFLVTQQWFHFDQNDVWSLFHSFSFDFSVWEMWGALLFGGRLVIIDRATSRSPEAFYNVLYTEKITILNNNPSVFQALTTLEESESVKPLSLRLVIFGAEPLKIQNLKPWFDRHGDEKPQLINLYGITESTVHTTYHPLSKKDLKNHNLIIGPPRAELHPLYILDDHLKPVPIGVPGQLYVGGHGLALEYLNQPQLTDERFLTDPFSNHPDSRLQKTGDLARFLESGNIAFLGRSDYQVKVRGFRIELGEIEAVLSQHPDIYEVAATTYEERVEENTEKRLVVYVEPHKQQQPEVENLKKYLKQKLPDYMIPTLFIIIPSLPRSPNGKVDRRLLPKPDKNLNRSKKVYDPPKTQTEQMVSETWSTLLTIKQISREDDFFDLGGHSLMATRVISRLRERFKLDLPLSLLFDTPTVKGISHYIDIKLLESNRLQPPPPIELTDRATPIPLSFAQQRLWFLEQLEGGLSTYTMPGAIQLRGTLDRVSLEKSIKTIIQRHESLRTTFPSVNGTPIQKINPTLNKPLIAIDLDQGLDEKTKQDNLYKIIEESMQKPFDLTEDILLRITLIRLDEQHHVLVFVMHHIASDGWSLSLFIQELSQFYNAFIQGKPASLPPLPIQYIDFSQWQHQWLKSASMNTQREYWKKQLSNAATLLELPTDRPRPPIQTFQGKDIYFQIDRSLSNKLSELSQRSGSTLFMTLLSVFATLLCRYSEQEDLIIGTPVANRNQAQTENLIGFFINTLALRIDLSDDPTFYELLIRVRNMSLEAFSHQDIPFEQLVEEIQPTRNLSHSPLFQVMFALQNTPSNPLELTHLTVTPLELVGKSSKFDLTLSMEETDQGLEGGFEFNTDLFDDTTIHRMIGHFKALLNAVTKNPECTLSKLSILNPSERQLLLETWNQTEIHYPQQDRCIHQLFEIQVEKTPNALALIGDDNRILTYSELNQHANQLAHYLRSLGVGVESLVGVCMQRNVEMIITLMAILKSGGAYVPLDPDYPEERIVFMVEDMQKSVSDAQTPIIITKQSIQHKLPKTKANIVCLDSLKSEFLNPHSKENPISLSHANNLAYVIYTSGSTGLPKGVAIEHKSTVSLILWTQHYYERSWFDQVLASTSICFDLSVFEIFVPLSWGGRIILVQNALALTQISESRHQVSLINTVPSAMNALLKNGPLPESVKLIILAGEPFKDTLAHLIYQNPSLLHFYNLYGPSEDTTYSTYARIPENLKGSPSIGRPIANTQCYILDRHLEPVPIGVIGELHLGGDGVARNYLNRPQLTEEKFIKNPFKNRGKLYKTGDLARYRGDGSIDFLGRRDHQVKVRGFRIELGEIENAINQHENSVESVVLVHTEENDSRYLVAYVVPKSQELTTMVSELRNHLKKTVPDYMVPAVFIILNEGLPLTTNGKLDRKALPDPQRSREGLETITLSEPKTSDEHLLVQLWKEVLGLDQVGIHDNFFDLGGDSILSIQIISRARQSGLIVTVKQIFQHQTIAELSLVAEKITALMVDQKTITGPVPLTAIQQWFFKSNNNAPHHFNQAHLLTTPADINPQSLQQSIQNLILWHDVLRLRFTSPNQDNPTEWQQKIISPNQKIPFTVEDFSELNSDQWINTLNERINHHQGSLDLIHGPLMKTVLFKNRSDQPGRLLFVIHHLAIDGVSWRILLEDLISGYEQAQLNQTIILPSKTTSFQQWATQITSEIPHFLTEEMPYWMAVISQKYSSLPLDYPSNLSKNTVSTTKQIRVSLDISETHNLIREIPKAYNTQINDILLTALSKALMKWSSNSGLVLVDLEGHGREELFKGLDLSRTVGWFTSLFPLSLDPGSDHEDPGSAIKRIKETIRAVPNRGIGYGLLSYIHKDPEFHAHLKNQQPAQISFNYFGQYDALLQESTLFSLASESSGSAIHSDTLRSHSVELNGFVTDGQMHWDFTYSHALHNAETIQHFSNHFLEILQQLINHCLTPEAGGFTPSDFPDADLDQDELDALLEDFE